MRILQRITLAIVAVMLMALTLPAQQVTIDAGRGGGIQVVQGGTLLGGPGGPNNDKPMATGTGIVFGRTIDAGTTRPVPGALVTISVPGSLPVRVMTDPLGQFVFRDLPKGRFSISAVRPGYVDGAAGRTRPGGPAQSIDLADDQRVVDLSIPMWKFASISGTVVDERGE